MIIDERARHDLHGKLETVLGDEAHTLMALLPSSGTEPATRADLDHQSALLRGEMAELRTEMAELRTELKTEMAELRTELKTEMAELRTEFKTDMANLTVEFKGGLASMQASLTREVAASMRTMILANVGTMLTGVGLAFTAAQLG